MKILNLYCGIGGNRSLWGENHEVTAVEIDEKIAKIYSYKFPKDKVIIGDAHQYLLENFNKFDFIWSSPPCQTHSRLNFTNQLGGKYQNRIKYPSMSLYEEIILLQHHAKSKWVIENVIPYYTPLIQPSFSICRHYFWSSDFILSAEFQDADFWKIKDKPTKLKKRYGYDDIPKELFKGVNTRQALRNCVIPELGRYILEQITGVNNVR